MYKYTPTNLMLPTSYYDQKRADFAVNFFQDRLKHITGEWYGKPFILTEWQIQIVRDIFGIVDRETKFRQFKTAYVEIPKKNGKSEFAAGIALYLLFADEEARAEVYSCAGDKQQAGIVFDTARDMIKQSPELSEISNITDSIKKIMFPMTNGFYKVLSSDVKTKFGFNIHGLIFDELLAQPTRELFDTMTKYSSDARRQPLHFLITTAGREKTSICYEMHSKAKGILNGSKSDPSFYPVIYGIQEDEDWGDPVVWKRVNPSIGVTIKLEKVQAAYEQALQNPAEEMNFRQFRLNEWTNADIRWIPMDKWEACGDDSLDLEDLKGRECYAGLDLSQTNDLTALILVFPPYDNEGKYIILPFFWLPEAVISLRSRRDHVPYEVWHKMGVFNVTEGEVVDYDYIVTKIEELTQIYNIQEIAYDRFGAEKIRRDLQEVGDEYGFEVFPFGQGYRSMSPPSKDLFQYIVEKKLRHFKHPVLDWNMGNVIIEQDAAGNIKPNKAKSTEKIDGAVALIMGFARAVLKGGTENASVYDERGLLFI